MSSHSKHPKHVILSSIKDVAATVEAAVPRKGKIVVGIAGPPGSGKSTIASKLEKALSPHAVLLTASQFRIPHMNLNELGDSEHKDAPDAFEVGELLHQLRDIKNGDHETLSSASIIIVEGDYLLINSFGWDEVAELIDLKFFVELKQDARITRLIERHLGEGKSLNQAMQAAFGVDERRARLVNPTVKKADYVIHLRD